MDQRPQHETQNSECDEENFGSTLQEIVIAEDFLYQTSAAQQIRLTIDKWDLVKLKGFCTAKEIIRAMKTKPTEWGETFTMDTSDRALSSRMYKRLKKKKKKQTK